MRPRFSIGLTTALLLMPSLTMAIRFPDVLPSYPHRQAIEQLSDLGVIGGNPDGTFRPLDPVNRAAMLKMLYLAAKIEPERMGGCFGDIVAGSWYEFYVCDAAAKGYVKGYGADGIPAELRQFKPAQPVTRAEALKLTLVVLGIPEADLSVAVDMYADVNTGDWFTRYVHTALANSVLPIPGIDGDTFSAAQFLERGEAAAYIWNGLHPVAFQAPETASSSSAGSDVSSSASSAAEMSDGEKRTAATIKTIEQEKAALADAKVNTKSVKLPFMDKGTFTEKKPFSYEFSLSGTMTVDIRTSITEWDKGSLTCRLYHMGRSGFSQEYYLGFQDGKDCMIRAALGAGSWRLQLQPETKSVSFTVDVKAISGDGNDGFSQALMLPLGSPRSGTLSSLDLEDWYKLTIPSTPKTLADGGQKLTLAVTSADPVGCLIYPLDNVDLYGFQGPQCNSSYLFPVGDYVVSVRHAAPFGGNQSYTIHIK